MIRVVIGEDHPELRLALRLYLNASENIEVVGEAANGHEAIELVRRHQPDVLVMDMEMPEMSGIEATKAIVALDLRTRVILISARERPAIARQAATVGAQGFVPKHRLIASLREAIVAVHRGERYFPGGHE